MLVMTYVKIFVYHNKRKICEKQNNRAVCRLGYKSDMAKDKSFVF